MTEKEKTIAATRKRKPGSIDGNFRLGRAAAEAFEQLGTR
jgi:hypothetical protein